MNRGLDIFDKIEFLCLRSGICSTECAIIKKDLEALEEIKTILNIFSGCDYKTIVNKISKVIEEVEDKELNHGRN